MTRIDLPDGGWADLSAPRKVQERKRRRYVSALADLTAATAELPRNPNNENETTAASTKGVHLELADKVGDMLILCLVREWSFGEVSDEVLATLTADCFDPLFMACRELSSELLPDFSPHPDPKAPTAGSTTPPTAT